MKILIYLGHPAQYHFFKNIVNILKENHQVKYLIKTKEFLESLMSADGVEYKNILPEGRKSSKTGIIWGLVKREVRMFKEVVKFKPDIMLSYDPSVVHIGKLLRIPAISVLEDDAHVIYNLAKITFPYAKHILAPKACDCGKWSKKQIAYDGYMKLSYLHPKYFHCKKNKDKKLAFIRLSGLDAFHDEGVNGFNEVLLAEIIDKLSKDFNVVISSEKQINSRFEKHLLKIKPSEIHEFLCDVSILLSDSQSMSVEAAMLGIPSIRYNDFSGRIGVLEELEHKYKLTFGIKSGDDKKLHQTLDRILSTSNMEEEFQKRRNKMLKDTIDVTRFFVWFIENYPKSATIMQKNPDYQYNFA